MSGRVNQFVIYRLRRDKREIRALRYQSCQYLKEHGFTINSDDYVQLYLAGFDPALVHTPQDLRKSIDRDLPRGVTGRALETGDILAITRDGISKAYYVDPDRLVPLSGFFHVASSSTVLTADTTGYTIEGRQGTWSAAEEMWIDGQNYLLMQNDEYGREAAYAVLDSHGRQAAEDTMDGFTDKVIEQIRAHLHTQNKTQYQSAEGMEKDSRTDIPSPPSSENTTEYTGAELLPVGETEMLSSAEPATEATERTQLSLDEKKEHEARQRRKKRRKNGKLPLKGRDSVLDRLKRYQEKLRRKKAEADAPA